MDIIIATFTDLSMLNSQIIVVYCISKYSLDQRHIKDCPARDGQKHLPFPQMNRHYKDNGDQLRDAVTAGKNADISQTVDDQKPEHRRGQHLSQILDILRRRLSRGKDHRLSES